MSFEKTYNNDLAKLLVGLPEPETYLNIELEKIKKRALSLNASRAKMAQGYEIVLEGLAEAFPDIDLEDPNLKGSPNRMARALIEICSGLGTKEEDIFSTTFPAEDYNQVIILKNINFVSLCSHHFFPFTGKASIGYLPDTTNPKEGRVIGLSKLARIVDCHAQRPQLQERLSYNIMKSIENHLNPSGVMVVVSGSHGCLNCRGAKKENAEMITSALSGQFKDDSKLRKEFLSLIREN
jgi:GTP cyclohydrolase I